MFLYLHPTMYLLILAGLGVSLDALNHLHPTMYLLILANSIDTTDIF